MVYKSCRLSLLLTCCAVCMDSECTLMLLEHSGKHKLPRPAAAALTAARLHISALKLPSLCHLLIFMHLGGSMNAKDCPAVHTTDFIINTVCAANDAPLCCLSFSQTHCLSLQLAPVLIPRLRKSGKSIPLPPVFGKSFLLLHFSYAFSYTMFAVTLSSQSTVMTRCDS